MSFHKTKVMISIVTVYAFGVEDRSAHQTEVRGIYTCGDVLTYALRCYLLPATS